MEYIGLQWILKAIRLLSHIMYPQTAMEGDIAVKMQWPFPWALGIWEIH
jgi:hypothetical protein